MTPFWAAAIAASIGGGIIHLALGPEHLDELGDLGLGFYLAAGLQLGWAFAVGLVVALGRAPRVLRGLAIGGIAINVAIVGAWAFSRLVGLPAGEMPWVPEAIGRSDAVAAVLEGGLVLGLAAGLRGVSVAWRPARLRGSIAAAVLAIAVIGTGTAFGLTGEAHDHGPGDAHAAGEIHGAGEADADSEADVAGELHAEGEAHTH